MIWTQVAENLFPGEKASIFQGSPPPAIFTDALNWSLSTSNIYWYSQLIPLHQQYLLMLSTDPSPPAIFTDTLNRSLSATNIYW